MTVQQPPVIEKVIKDDVIFMDGTMAYTQLLLTQPFDQINVANDKIMFDVPIPR